MLTKENQTDKMYQSFHVNKLDSHKVLPKTN